MKKLVLALGATACGVMSLGCGTEPNEGVAEPAAEVWQGDLLLQDSFSSSAALTVVRDRTTGDVGITVHGRIGVDDISIVKTALLKSTFAESYRTLHPDMTQVPAQVQEISDLLKLQRTRIRASMPKEDLELKAQATATVDKNSSTFYANACQVFGGPFEGYSPAYCSFQYNWHSICTYSTIGWRDQSVGWNESPYNATHSLSGMSWKPTIPAWNWYVTEWGGSYSNRYACLTLSGSNTGGNLGITHHDFFTDQHFQGFPG